MKVNASGELVVDESGLSDTFVPYTGATANVDLGARTFITSGTGTFGSGIFKSGSGITLGDDLSSRGYIKMFASIEDPGSPGSSYYTTFTTNTGQSAYINYTLPAARPTANSQALLSSTGGAFSWGTNFGANNILTSGTLGAGAITSTGNIGGATATIAGDVTANNFVSTAASGDVLYCNAGNNDVNVWRVDSSGGYGFYQNYLGSGSGNENSLQLWTQGLLGADVQVYEVKQDGIFNVTRGLKVKSGVQQIYLYEDPTYNRPHLDFGSGTANNAIQLQLRGGFPTIGQSVERDSVGGLAFGMFELEAKSLDEGSGTGLSETLGKIGVYGDFDGGVDNKPRAFYIYMDVTPTANWNNALFKIGATGVGIGLSSAGLPTATLHVDQASASGAKPVVKLDQGDVDDTFIDFRGTSAANGSRSISSDTTEESTKFGAIRIEINGVTKWIRIYDNES